MSSGFHGALMHLVSSFVWWYANSKQWKPFMGSLFHAHPHLLSFSKKKKRLNCLWKVVCVVHVSDLCNTCWEASSAGSCRRQEQVELLSVAAQGECSISCECRVQLPYQCSRGGKLLPKFPAKL